MLERSTGVCSRARATARAIVLLLMRPCEAKVRPPPNLLVKRLPRWREAPRLASPWKSLTRALPTGEPRGSNRSGNLFEEHLGSDRVAIMKRDRGTTSGKGNFVPRHESICARQARLLRRSRRLRLVTIEWLSARRVLFYAASRQVHRHEIVPVPDRRCPA